MRRERAPAGRAPRAEAGRRARRAVAWERRDGIGRAARLSPTATDHAQRRSPRSSRRSAPPPPALSAAAPRARRRSRSPNCCASTRPGRDARADDAGDGGGRSPADAPDAPRAPAAAKAKTRDPSAAPPHARRTGSRPRRRTPPKPTAAEAGATRRSVRGRRDERRGWPSGSADLQWRACRRARRGRAADGDAADDRDAATRRRRRRARVAARVRRARRCATSSAPRRGHGGARTRSTRERRPAFGEDGATLERRRAVRRIGDSALGRPRRAPRAAPAPIGLRGVAGSDRIGRAADRRRGPADTAA